MTNIFRVSHILLTYFTSLQASEITAKYEKLAYRYHEKYLLSVTVIQHLSREKTQQ